MEYIINEENSSFTDDYYFSVVGNKPIIQNKNIESFEPLKVVRKIKSYFTKTSYQYFTVFERKSILEYLISNYASKPLNIFSEYKDLKFNITEKKELLKYFLLHLIILRSELEEELTPIKLLEEIEKNLINDAELNFINLNFYLKPKGIFSTLSTEEIVKLRIEDTFNLLIDSDNFKEHITLIIFYLIMLDSLDEFFK